ncbi:MAG: acryloyl-CoA reductase [Gammaproteobacteria bacterium]|nr:MAG: acryloyl-CoA reductase [Gammaproteobacteria bacterium]
MKKFPAFRIFSDQQHTRSGIEQLSIDDLCEGEVVIRVKYSSVNYKDALAGTGKAQILRRSPLVGGIDLAGEVVESASSDFGQGDQVLVNGSGLSETHDGGYAEFARVPADWVVPLPNGLTLAQTMIIGTAGFTAALSIHLLQQNNQQIEDGPIVVTGASGGVGSFAIDLLHKLGYETIAVTGSQDAHEYLYELGASKVVAREKIQIGSGVLEKTRWAGAIDNVGGDTLSALVRASKPWGNVVSVGIAGGVKFKLSAMPFIIRGVNLLGVSSSNCPQLLRKQIWSRLGDDLHPEHIAKIKTQTTNLDNLPMVFEKLLNNEIRGRVLVEI